MTDTLTTTAGTDVTRVNRAGQRTLYATFADASQAEKAAGALLDHGVHKDDVSLVANDAYGHVRTTTPAAAGTTSYHTTDAGSGTAQQVGHSAVDATKSAGDRLAQAGHRTVAAVAGAVGADGMAARHDIAADEKAAAAETRADMAQHESAIHGTAPSTAGNVANSAVDHSKEAGNRVAQAADRTAATVAGAVGAEGTAANYDVAADQRAANADTRSAMAHNEDVVHGSNVVTGTPTNVHPAAAGSTLLDRDVTTEPVRYDESNLAEDRIASDRAAADRVALGHDTADRDVVAHDHADHQDLSAKTGISTTTPGDAGAGAIEGAGIGLGLGILGGLASLIIPGFGLVVGGGALAMAIAAAAGTTVAGAVAGGVTGYLKDMGVPDNAAQTYQGAVEGGGAVLSVTLPSGNVDVVEAQEILSKYGAGNLNAY